MTDTLFRRVLLPVSDEEDIEATGAVARSYFENYAGELVFVYVIEVAEDELGEPSSEELTERAGDVFAIVREGFEDAPVPIRTELRRGTDVVEEISTTADEIDATVIALAPEPENRMTELLENHETGDENRHPVITLPYPSDATTDDEAEDREIADSDRTTVVVPIDGSEPSIEAVRHACVTFPDAEITLLHVLESQGAGIYESMTGGSSNGYEKLEKQRQREVDEIFDNARNAVVEFDPDLSTETLTGDVAEMVVTYAENGEADQIIMGNRGKGGVTKRLFGSVSETVVDRSSVPVMVVK